MKKVNNIGLVIDLSDDSTEFYNPEVILHLRLLFW